MPKLYKLIFFLLPLFLGISYCKSADVKEKNLENGLIEMRTQIERSLKEGNKKSIAILDFTDLSGKKVDLGKYLSEKLIFTMFDVKGITVIERNQLNKVLKELNFHQNGLIDKGTIKEVGRLTGANALLIGTLTDMKEVIDVNGRIVNTENGEILAVMSVALKKDEQIKQLTIPPTPKETKTSPIAEKQESIFKTGKYQIGNVWKQEWNLHMERGKLEAAAIKEDWLSAQWKIEKAQTGFFNICNVWKLAHCIHIEKGNLEAGPIEPGWLSAQWKIEKAETGFYNICNVWKANHCIHIERGELEAEPIEPGWLSAQWKFKKK
ncbi:MAG: hypothetical protein H7A25_24865 [Leptospiraceae bacterium]|nr:hypothetical protein [Leptospiraceae bacterium]MCP5503155.1 hypothetical protein [Leptospiraceae bacterium]